GASLAGRRVRHQHPTADCTMNLLTRIGAITRKEFRQLSRDRMTFGMVVMIPLIQLLLFGYAINLNIRHIPAGVTDLANSSLSRSIVASATATQVVDLQRAYSSVQEAETAITRGEVKAVLVLPADLERRYNDGQPRSRLEGGQALGQWLVDGSDTVVAGAIRGLGNLPVHPVRPQAGRDEVPNFDVVLYFNPEQRTAVNIVPGLLATILTMTMILFTSTAIVRERERGNLELLITTPLHPVELMIGKILPYILIGVLQTGIILGLGRLVFDVPIQGSAVQILSATLLFITASLTLGLIISTIAKTQLQAMQMTVFVLLPSILLSGFMFPYDGMPEPAQWIAEALPATHFVRMIRAVVLRGAEVGQLVGDSLFLAGFTCVGMVVASLKFHKRLD